MIPHRRQLFACASQPHSIRALRKALAAAVLLIAALAGSGSDARAQVFGTLVPFGATANPGQAPNGTLIQATDGYLYGATNAGGSNSVGSVFKLDSAGNVTVLHSFSKLNNDGQSPYGTLIQASDGFLYGTTYAGGAYSQGTVFRVDGAGNLTVLTSFGGVTGGGQNPYGGLIQGADGAFYGTTLHGGTSGSGAAFKMDTNGNVAVLTSFGGVTGGGASPYAGLIQASDGFLYGTTWSGGANNKGTVFKMDTSGNLTVLHAFAGADGGYPVASMYQASDGFIYGSTQYGGTNYTSGPTGDGTIFKVDTSGNFSVVHKFGSFAGEGVTPVVPLMQATDGFLYGTTPSGGTYNYGTVFKMDTSGNASVIHSFDIGGLDGQSSQGGLLQAGDHSLYGTCETGGADGGGTVFRIKRGRGFDANNDGMSDILFRNTTTGDVTLWEMNGLNIINQGFVVQAASLLFQVAGTGDFNGDGFSDVLLRDTSTGDVYVWELYGFNIGIQGYVYQGLSLAWQVEGIGDFNGDCKSDILWRNTLNGDVVLWEMNGLTIAADTVVQARLPLVWQVAGIGDFNGDGMADILWRNTSTGDVVEWEMNGATIVSQTTVSKALPLVWQVAGIGDFTGDGMDDILWRNTSTGDVVLWEMDGPTITADMVVQAGLPLVWQAAGVGDFTGNGMADILWRNTSIGDVVLWEMNGATIGSQGAIDQGLSLVWQIAAP